MLSIEEGGCAPSENDGARSTLRVMRNWEGATIGRQQL